MKSADIAAILKRMLFAVIAATVVVFLLPSAASDWEIPIAAAVGFFVFGITDRRGG